MASLKTDAVSLVTREGPGRRVRLGVYVDFRLFTSRQCWVVAKVVETLLLMEV